MRLLTPKKELIEKYGLGQRYVIIFYMNVCYWEIIKFLKTTIPASLKESQLHQISSPIVFDFPISSILKTGAQVIIQSILLCDVYNYLIKDKRAYSFLIQLNDTEFISKFASSFGRRCKRWVQSLGQEDPPFRGENGNPL